MSIHDTSTPIVNDVTAASNTNGNPADKASALAANALADLAAKLEAGHSDALTSYLRFLAKFHRYSALNCLLIQIQNPDATHVAGYGRWQELKRQVRKGEKGIAILAPCTFKKQGQDEADDATKDKRSSRRQSDAVEDEPQTVTRFRTAYVFDVSQTEGEDLPTLNEVTGNPGYQLAALKSLVTERGIKVEYRDDLGGARGMSTGGKILLLCGMPHAETFSVLVHEFAHELLHKGERRAETNVRIRELEAEATAFVITTAVGLSNDSASRDYIQLYGGNAKLLAQSLQHIQKVSCEILDYLL